MKHFLLKTMLLLCALVVGSNAWATEGDEITSISNIVDGQSYYIKGVRTSNTYYLKFTDSTGSQSGTESTTKADAQLITFHKQSDGVYTLETSNGNYIAPGTSNGKINVSASAINVTASNQSSKIRLSITSGNDTWSIQKNTSAANFGGYKNTQTDITLIEGPATKTATTVTLNPTSWTFNLADDDLTKSLSATVKAGNNNVDGAAVTWSVSQGSDYASVSNTGVVSALAAGTAKIKASYAGDATYAASSAECTVTVNKANTAVTIGANTWGIDLKPANKAPINLSASVKAIKSDESTVDLTNPAITWSVQSGSDYVDVSDAGVVTGKAKGTATIRASYAGGDNYNPSYTECQITVEDTRSAVNMTGFSVTTNPIEVENTTATTVTNDQSGWTPAYTYTSSNTDVAEIAADGTITAKAKGTTTIRATLNIAADNADYILGETTYKEFDLTVYNHSYTATFSVNGDVTRTATVEEGQPITFPTAVETTPGAGEFPKVINGKTFQGWVTSAIATPTNTAPEFIDTDDTDMGGANITYYAVYAKVTQVESDDIADADVTTLQYDTWTYYGTTENKSSSSYRLFAEGAYVESPSINLSKLLKVNVYAGTYGTLNNSKKKVTVMAGSTTWGTATLTSNDQTKKYELTSDAILSGNGTLQIIAGGGDGSSNGIRMTKVEIFVKGTSKSYSKYSTTVSMLPIPEITMADVQMTWGDTDKSVAPSATISGVAYAGTFTYESSSANLTVAADGKLTCNVPGTYKVKAMIAGTDDYQDAEQECNVIVAKQNITIAFPNNNAAVEKIISDTAADNKHSQAATVAPAAYDGTVTYAITGDTNGASIDGTEVTYTKSGTITVTATAPATDLYNTNTASYNLNVSYANIAQVKALTSSATQVTFAATLTDAVVTYVEDDYAYLQDGTAAVMVNFENHGLTAGQKINGKVTGKVKASNQIDILTELDVTGATVTDDGVIPAATVATLATIKSAGTDYDGKLVTVNAAKVTTALTDTANGDITDDNGTTSFKLVCPFTGVNAEKDVKANFTGFISIYNGSTYRLNIYEASQIEITHNAPQNQTLAFTSDAFELDEDTDAFTNFAPQTVSGAQGTVTYAIANTSGDVIYENFNTADGTFTLKAGAYGTATITATAAATNVEDEQTHIITPYNEATKSYTVTTYPRYTVKFYVNGEETTLREETHGAGVTVPTPITIEGYSFRGWSTSEVAETNDAPSMSSLDATIKPEGNATYYAVYAKETSATSNATLTIQPSTANIPTSYGTANTFTEYSFEGKKFKVQQMYKSTDGNQNDILQWRSGTHDNGAGTMYNTDPLDNIQSIELTYNSSDDHKNFTVKVGSNSNPTGGTSITPSISGTVYTFDCSTQNSNYFVLTNGEYAGYLNKIVITYVDDVTTYSGYTTSRITGVENRSMAADKIGTICLPYAVKAADIEGAKVYTVAGKTVDSEGNLQYITINELEGDMVAGTPYIFKTTADAQSFTYVPTAKANAAGNANGLVGAFEETEITKNENNFIFSGGVLYLVDSDDVWVGANRAYIHLADVPENTSNVKGINIFADGVDATAITAPYTTVQGGVYYNLQGQRVENPTHGIFILNGKKVFIK